MMVMRLWATVVGVVLLSYLPGCAAAMPPQEVVRDFLLAWQGGHYREAAGYTDGDRTQVAAALRGAARQLGAHELRFGLGRFDRSDGIATAAFTVEVDVLGESGPEWAYRGELTLRRGGDGWKVAWSPSVIHPELGPGQRLAAVTDASPRAPILDSEDRRLVRDGRVVTVGVRPGRSEPADRTGRAVAALARTTGIETEGAVDVVRAAPERSFVPLVTLPRAAFRRLEPALSKVPELRFRDERPPVDARPRFAGALVGQVGPATSQALRRVGAGYGPGDSVGTDGLQLAYQSRLAGTPETRVVAQDADGRVVKVLARWPGEEPRPVRTTVDRDAQVAAAAALAPLRRPASVVAVDSSSGDILAAANRGTDGNEAFIGHYPPGDVFRLVSSAALLDTGLDLHTPIPCPPRRIVGGEVFTSRSGTPRAPAFRVSFANSCTTAFAGLARRLPADALAATASDLGVGGNWTLPVPAFAGFLPPPRDDADKAAYMIGEGSVRVSPLTMALAAAAVESGTWRPPRLVTEPATERAGEPHPLPREQVKPLRALLRTSVEAGVAAAADLPGEPVYGMAGTATSQSGSGEQSYAWFVGFRGDVAFAMVLRGDGEWLDGHSAGGSAAAGPAARFLQALPGRYR